jgi:hypothetical protein
MFAAITAAGLGLSLATGKVGAVFRGLGSSSDEPAGDVAFDNLLEFPSLLTGSLGTWYLGWFDSPVPAVTPTLMIGVVAALLFVGMQQASRDKSLAIGVAVVALVAVPMYTLAVGRTPVGQGMQPRYLLPLLPIVATSALLRSRVRGPVMLGRGQVVAIGAALAIAHGAALHQTIRRYVTGTDVSGFDLGAGLEWWWARGPAPMIVWSAGAVSFAVVLAAVLVVTGAAAPTATPVDAHAVTTSRQRANRAVRAVPRRQPRRRRTSR